MAQSGRRFWIWSSVIVLTGLWAILIYQLSAQWLLYSQYNYGGWVPFLVLALLWRRWKDRPEPVAPAQSPWLIFAAILLALAMLPTRVVQEANVTWRLSAWALTLEVVGISLLAVYRAGGRNWLRHFGFPILFFLVAVPWPSAPEAALIKFFTQLDVRSTVEALGWFAIPAFQRGNVIEVSTGLVGIDEACSGVRSFQATLMLALLFGEVYRLVIARRAALLFAGLGIAFLGNLLRTFLLVWVCSRQGMEAMRRWHDPTGVGILLMCFIGQWLLAVGLRKRTAGAPAIANAPPVGAFPQLLPHWSIPLLAVWLVTIEASTEIWYRSRESGVGVPRGWTVQWPVASPQFRDLPITSAIREQLYFDEGKSAQWHEENGGRWQVFYFRWLPARTLIQRARVQFAKGGHRPEACLPAIGMKLRQDLGTRSFAINGVNLYFRNYVFEDGGALVHVYYCIWEDQTQGAAPGNPNVNAESRLERVWTGNRSLGERVLEMAVWGIPSDQEAEASLVEQLKKIIVQKQG